MLNEALRKVVTALDSLGIPHALIGGLAVAARGAFRATKDVDLIVDRPVQEGPALERSLKDSGFDAAFHRGAADDPVAGVLRLAVPVAGAEVKCDLLFPSLGWQTRAVRNATSVDLGGFIVRVAEPADLFLLKLYAAGPQDLIDAAQLLELQSPAERARWKAAAKQIRLTAEYNRCLKFLEENVG
ncbi:MAG: hypothetical protein ACLQOO_29385 [Terriglobia bacterium]